ncbi:unnamed protein product [Heterobilharzia americana]|nr:unnamed protein product [Heterobilharzia americana]
MREAYDVVKSGGLLEFEHHLHDSGCSETSYSSIGSTSTFGSPASLCSTISYVPTESSGLYVPKSSSYSSSFALSLTPTSPKVLSKKRDRPTYLGLEATSSSFGGFLEKPVRKSSLHCAAVIGPIPESGTSPTEGKRSRISALLSPTRSPSALLPSPCTGLSKLEISSPLEEYRSLLSFARAPSSIAPGHVLPGPETTDLMLKFRPFLSSSTSLQTLKFEPCSTVLPLHPIQLTTAFSPGNILRLRRSSSTIATVRPTLLAHRRLSSHASAPPTPRPISVETGHVVYHNLLHSRGSFPLPGSLPATNPSRVRELSPCNPISQEPKLEYEQLQKCDTSFDVNKQSEVSVNLAECSSLFSGFQGPSLHSNLPFPFCNEDINKSRAENDQMYLPVSLRYNNSSKSSQLSRSAPSQRDIDLVFCTDQGVAVNSSRRFSFTHSSLLVRSELVSSSPSLTELKRSDLAQTSTTITISAVAAAARLLPQVSGSKSSCRRQQQSFVQSSSSSSPSSSTSHNSTHSSNYGLFPIS